MLDGLRDFAKSWPGKVLGAFMLVGIAGFGINNVILDLGSNTIARVGSEEINSREFLRAYQSLVNQIGSVPTASEAEASGLPTRVLLGLSQGAALDQMANQFGLGVSDAKLAEMLRQDPSFKGTLGNFDPSIFTQVLQRSGWTEAEYFEARAQEAKREQLTQSLLADAKLPAAAVDLLNGYATTKRTIDYLTLTEANIEPPAAPTEEELAAYLAEHQAEYRTVETRTVKLLDLSIASLAATKTVDDAAVEAEYERTKDTLTTPEKRTIEQVALTTPEAQATFETGLSAGTDFAALATQAGVTPSSLGSLSRQQVTDARLGDAAFALPQGGFAIIDGVGGKRAIHVSAIEPAGAPTLEEAKADIVNRLASAQARDEINDILDQIEELRAAFQPLDQIGARFGLPVYEAKVTAGGAELSVLPYVQPVDYPRVATAIFQAEQGKLTPSIPMTGNAHVWFDLEAVDAARDQTLDEVRDRLTTAMTEERTNNALLELGKTIVARLNAGEDLVNVASELNVFPQISTQFSRFGSDDGSVDQTVAAAAFAGGPDLKGSVVNESGEVIVFSVAEDTPPAEPLNAQAIASIDDEARNGLQGEFVAALREDAGLKINQQALNQLLVQNFGQ